mmetsp:Transcript_1367/g.5034  ORF Transcript_1367/g.5034 Transcript_1367/m.5034 type:complete len:312 (-) Transcript_1367:1945-2880(-)
MSSGVSAGFTHAKSRRAASTTSTPTTARVGRRVARTVSYVSQDPQLEVVGDGVRSVDGVIARERSNSAKKRTRDDDFLYGAAVFVIAINFSILKSPPAWCRSSFAGLLRRVASRWWWFSRGHGSGWHAHRQRKRTMGRHVRNVRGIENAMDYQSRESDGSYQTLRESGPTKCVEEVVRNRRWGSRMVEERINVGRWRGRFRRRRQSVYFRRCPSVHGVHHARFAHRRTASIERGDRNRKLSHESARDDRSIFPKWWNQIRPAKFSAIRENFRVFWTHRFGATKFGASVGEELVRLARHCCGGGRFRATGSR